MHSLLLPLRGAAEGFTTAELGLIGTGWAIGFVLGCLTAPIVVRRVGHIRAFACSAACAAIIILLNGIVVAAARLDPAPRRLRLLPRRRLHDHRELAERARHQREPRHDLRRLPDGHLSRHHRRPARRRRSAIRGTPTLFMVGAILFSLAVLPTALSTAASPRPLTRVRIDLRKLFLELARRLPDRPARRRHQRRLRHAWRRLGRAHRPFDAAHRADDGHHRRLGRADAAARRPPLRPDRPPLRHRRRGDRGRASRASPSFALQADRAAGSS